MHAAAGYRDVIEYLRAEHRALREKLGKKRILRA